MNKKPNRAFITFIILAILCFIVFNDYLLFKKAYFFYDISSDGFYSYFPSLYNSADYVSHSLIPKWSFKVGMGQNIFPASFQDPFDVLLFFTGKNSIASLIVYIEVLKIIASGMVFFYYLRLRNFSAYTCIIGSILFAFSGFMTETSAWFGFTFEAFNFALFLLAFELLYVKQKWQLFSISVFLVCIYMPFNLFLFGLFIAVYAIFRHCETGKFDAKKLGVLFAQMLGLGVIGILISGPFIIEGIIALLNSPRGAGDNSQMHILSSIPVFHVSDHKQLGTAIMRFFSNDILGSGNNFKGWDTILGAPLFYCGLPCLLLFPQVFVQSNNRTRVAFILFFTVWLIPVVFPFFRRAIWLFSGDYYRLFSLFVTFVFMYFTFYAMEFIFQKRKINVIVLLSTFVVLVAVLFLHPFIDKTIIDFNIRSYVVILLLVYTIAVCLINEFKDFRVAKYFFLIIVLVEIYHSANFTVNSREFISQSKLKEKFVYNDYSLDAVKYIQSHDHSFYRIDKNFSRPSSRFTTLNYSQIQGYNSTSSYSSFNQLWYTRFLQTMGIADKTNEQDSRYAIGLLNSPVLESENSVKYFLSVNRNPPIWPEMWDSLTKIGNVTIYKNKFIIPFGFTCAQFVKESNFNFASAQQRQFITMHAVAIKDDKVNKVTGMSEFMMKDTLGGLLNFNAYEKNFRETGHVDTLTQLKFEDNFISGNVSVAESRILCLSIPYDEGWRLTVDGKEREKLVINGGLTGCFLNKGDHHIEISFCLRSWPWGMIMSVLGIGIFIGLWYFKRNID